MTDKNLHDEIAELAEAVRELRDREVAAELAGLRAEVEKLRAERAAHQCTCAHLHWHTYPTIWGAPAAPYPNYVVTCDADTTTITTATNMAAGVGSTYTLALGN